MAKRKFSAAQMLEAPATSLWDEHPETRTEPEPVPEPVPTQSKPGLSDTQIMNLIQAACRAGLRIEFSWGMISAFHPSAREKCRASCVPAVNSEYYRRPVKWSVSSEETDDVRVAAQELFEQLPGLSPAQMVQPPERKKRERPADGLPE